jgi:hypothetical protein
MSMGGKDNRTFLLLLLKKVLMVSSCVYVRRNWLNGVVYKFEQTFSSERNLFGVNLYEDLLTKP